MPRVSDYPFGDNAWYQDALTLSPPSHSPLTLWCGVCMGPLPLTVKVTSLSPAPTRGTTARHTYFPASSWRTDLRVRVFSLLRT